MRRGSLRAGAGEPLIVVEESACGEEAADGAESPPDPYLLSPWRDTRKHSLPTPACTSGPTASQVRRLSERGEGSARAAREAAFLATLSQAPPQPGARRHSVVTISRVPQSLFGRGRRESVAALPVRARRDSNASTPCPPATESLGSTHNLQLDIMDDIVAARRVRMRVWSAAGERLCEVQPLGGAAGAAGTRYARRRHSAQPQGVVCSDADLAALTSSAADLAAACPPAAPRPRLADTRSRSFDAGALRGADPPGAWLARRHQTLATKRENMARPPPDRAKVMWDKPSGSVVDAQALGSAIEVFLRGGASEPPPRPPAPPPRPAPPARPAPPWPEADAPDACDSALCSSIKDLFVK